ncbi:cysteine dioxygenase [Streptomyces fuscigenes]|uniref:cysteine dioxygenase n=1 Tax=Streptomyces fuscigenes TaxID=1528880 RepID=UPI001F412849|nr:cysteine dioxygenase [Streptomyces fuscigenes]MCF3961168.1 cysteine dioxygenase [Streptomyces fuscigenes]
MSVSASTPASRSASSPSAPSPTAPARSAATTAGPALPASSTAGSAAGSAPSASFTAGSASSASASPSAGPSPAELLSFVRATAADAELVASLPLDPEGRTWIRLDGPEGSEAWLIGWPPGTGTGWHDHGGSYGAFATAAGALREDSLAARLPTEGWKTLELAEGVDRNRLLEGGDARAFGEHHVHEVRNESGTTHAVSVHAYYPPLPMMRRYSRSGAVLRLEEVERPEEWQ